MFNSQFNSTLSCMSLLAIAAFALVPSSMVVAQMVWVGGSVLSAALNR